LSNHTRRRIIFPGPSFSATNIVSTWFYALLPALLSVLIPATAWGDIYKWTDERGETVISDVLPANLKKVKDFEVLVRETPRTQAQRDAANEKMLLDRIERLERQVQAQRYAPPAPAAPPPPAYSYYSPEYAAPPPPPQPDYFGSYFPSFYPAYSLIVAPSRGFARPRGFGFNRGGFSRGGMSHRGRR
jgi:hypothetical protein